MTLFFKERFKEKLLSGAKIATIRGKKHLNVDTEFNVNLGSRYNCEKIGTALCIGVNKVRLEFELIYKSSDIDGDRYSLHLDGGKLSYFILDNADAHLLGFNTILEAKDFYSNVADLNRFISVNEPTRTEGYLHIFKMLKED